MDMTPDVELQQVLSQLLDFFPHHPPLVLARAFVKCGKDITRTAAFLAEESQDSALSRDKEKETSEPLSNLGGEQAKASGGQRLQERGTGFGTPSAGVLPAAGSLALEADTIKQGQGSFWPPSAPTPRTHGQPFQLGKPRFEIGRVSEVKTCEGSPVRKVSRLESNGNEREARVGMLALSDCNGPQGNVIPTQGASDDHAETMRKVDQLCAMLGTEELGRDVIEDALMHFKGDMEKCIEYMLPMGASGEATSRKAAARDCPPKAPVFTSPAWRMAPGQGTYHDTGQPLPPSAALPEPNQTKGITLSCSAEWGGMWGDRLEGTAPRCVSTPFGAEVHDSESAPDISLLLDAFPSVDARRIVQLLRAHGGDMDATASALMAEQQSQQEQTLDNEARSSLQALSSARQQQHGGNQLLRQQHQEPDGLKIESQEQKPQHCARQRQKQKRKRKKKHQGQQDGSAAGGRTSGAELQDGWQAHSDALTNDTAHGSGSSWDWLRHAQKAPAPNQDPASPAEGTSSAEDGSSESPSELGGDGASDPYMLPRSPQQKNGLVHHLPSASVEGDVGRKGGNSQLQGTASTDASKSAAGGQGGGVLPQRAMAEAGLWADVEAGLRAEAEAGLREEAEARAEAEAELGAEAGAEAEAEAEAGIGAEGPGAEAQANVELLRELFPTFDVSTLEQVLLCCNGSLEEAFAMMEGSADGNSGVEEIATPFGGAQEREQAMHVSAKVAAGLAELDAAAVAQAAAEELDAAAAADAEFAAALQAAEAAEAAEAAREQGGQPNHGNRSSNSSKHILMSSSHLRQRRHPEEGGQELQLHQWSGAKDFSQGSASASRGAWGGAAYGHGTGRGVGDVGTYQRSGFRGGQSLQQGHCHQEWRDQPASDLDKLYADLGLPAPSRKQQERQERRQQQEQRRKQHDQAGERQRQEEACARRRDRDAELRGQDLLSEREQHIQGLFLEAQERLREQQQKQQQQQQAHESQWAQGRATGRSGTEDLYRMHRQNAFELKRRRDNCRQLAWQARGRQNYAAFESLMMEADRFHEMSAAAMEEAGDNIFSANNQRFQNHLTLDLHNLHVQEALDKLLPLADIMAAGGGVHSMSVITGRGNHSEGGKPRIKPAVLDLLRAKGLTWREESNGGALFVQRPGSA